MRRLNALALAAALVGWSVISPRLPPAWRATLQAVVGALLIAATRAPLGLRPPELRAGARLGLAAGAVATTTIAATTAVPPVRAGMAVREPPASVPVWLLLRIPFGTVWAEEAAFRAALGAAGAAAFGSRSERLLQASAFGLSHIADARAASDPVVLTVLVTGVAGWLFGWLAERSGSLAAPMLAHLAINEAGAIATLTVRP